MKLFKRKPATIKVLASGRQGVSIFDEMITERGGEPLVIPVEEFANLYINIKDSEETLQDKREHYRER